MKIELANPRGFCAVVDRAIEIVDRAIDVFGAPIYVRHEVVHNRYVVDGLRDRGAVFVEELEQVPDDATVIFSAHGVSSAVQNEADRRGLKVFDATCPLVTKVHMEVARYAARGVECVLIGHAGHPEVQGTLWRYDTRHGGQIYLVETPDDARQLQPRNAEQLAYVTQTTLSMDDTAEVIDALRETFEHIVGPRRDDICYATQNRQDAVRGLAKSNDLVLVVGSVNSSNSNRLRELSEREGTPAYLIDQADDLRPEWLAGVQSVGVTAGASAPEVLVQGVIDRLQSLGGDRVEELDGRPETIVFNLPKELRLIDAG